MPTTIIPPQDDELDPLEHADQEELADDTLPITSDDEVVLAPIDPDEEITAEIDKVAVADDEDAPIKHKANMIPRDLIERDLTIEDLFDDGEI